MSIVFDEFLSYISITNVLTHLDLVLPSPGLYGI